MSLDKSKLKNVIVSNEKTHDIWISSMMNLSEEIYGNDPVVYQNIIDTIAKSMQDGDTIRKLSMKLYDGYNSEIGVIKPAELPLYLLKLINLALSVIDNDLGALENREIAFKKACKKNEIIECLPLKNAYSNLTKACCSKRLKKETIEKKIWCAVQEKSRYHAMRIARTESQRAWFQGFVSESQTDPLVFGYRWGLSSKHQYVPFDICDVFARMDVGFGRGIYYKNRLPLIPVHPHCGCMLYRVFVTDIDKSARFNLDKAREYFNTLTYSQKKVLFGTKGSLRYEDGEDWQTLLKGWTGFHAPEVILKDYGIK